MSEKSFDAHHQPTSLGSFEDRFEQYLVAHEPAQFLTALISELRDNPTADLSPVTQVHLWAERIRGHATVQRELLRAHREKPQSPEEILEGAKSVLGIADEFSTIPKEDSVAYRYDQIEDLARLAGEIVAIRYGSVAYSDKRGGLINALEALKKKYDGPAAVPRNPSSV